MLVHDAIQCLSLYGACREGHTVRADITSADTAEEAVQPQTEAADASSLVSAKEERDLQVRRSKLTTTSPQSRQHKRPSNGF